MSDVDEPTDVQIESAAEERWWARKDDDEGMDEYEAVERHLTALRDGIRVLTQAAKHPFKGPNDTDASMLLDAATRLQGGFEVGGSNTQQTVARVLRAVAALLSHPDKEGGQ